MSEVGKREAEAEGAARDLARRLRARSTEIEAALIAQLHILYEDLEPEARSGMVAGAQVVIPEMVAYSIKAFEDGDDWSDPIPDTYAETARWAARDGMPLEHVLLGYSTGNTVISAFVAEEVQGISDPGLYLTGVEVQSRVAKALISGLSAAYAEELGKLETSAAGRLTHQVESLLAGDSMQAADLGYQLDAWHIAAVISGADAKRGAELLTERLGCEVLLVPRVGEVHWVWWGSPRKVGFEQVETAAESLKGSVFIAVGEGREGVEGFRRSHREAKVATAVMIRRSVRLIRCLDVMLPGLLLQDPEVGSLFLDAYLGALKAQRNWPALRDTLLAYFDAEGNLNSAASALGVNRQTVRRRVSRAEEILGVPIRRRRVELEAALRVDELASTKLARDRLPGDAPPGG